jgi:hypothetical protein
MNTLPALPAPALDRDIADLARAMKRANGPVISLANRLGGGIERQMAAIPPRIREELEKVTATALTAAFGAGGVVPKLGRRGTLAAAIVSGAAGGAGGLATSVAELPVTIAVMLKAIREEAEAAGFDPREEVVRAACIQVFAAGSPLSHDDGVDTSFLSARLTLTGPALQKVIATVAPRLAVAMGQKLAAQAIPVLGAVSGAALNAAYLKYYREMARIRFALMRLTVQHGAEAVMIRFASATEKVKITKV